MDKPRCKKSRIKGDKSQQAKPTIEAELASHAMSLNGNKDPKLPKSSASKTGPRHAKDLKSNVEFILAASHRNTELLRRVMPLIRRTGSG